MGFYQLRQFLKRFIIKLKVELWELKLNTFINLKFNNIIKLIIVLLDER